MGRERGGEKTTIQFLEKGVDQAGSSMEKGDRPQEFAGALALLQVNTRLTGLQDVGLENKAYLDKHVSSVKCLANDAKRKWEEFSMHAQEASKYGSDFSASKHCRMELLLQRCVNTVDAASEQKKLTHAAISEISRKDVDVEEIVSYVMEHNELLVAEVDSARSLAENDATKNSQDFQRHFEKCVSAHVE